LLAGTCQAGGSVGTGHKIRIGIGLTSFHRGGTEQQILELMRRLDGRRFETHLICFRRQGAWLQRAERSATSITEFPLETLRSRQAARQFARLVHWLSSSGIDVLQTCDVYSNIFALPAASVAQVPVRIASRRGIVQPTDTRGLFRLQRMAYRCAHKVVANSQAAADVLVRERLDQRRIVIIPNGIEHLPGMATARGGNVITTVANLRRGKGHDILLHAAADVLAHHPRVLFQIVGDGPLRQPLETLAASLGIDGQVRFLGHRDDVGLVLRQSDLFAFPSFMEAFPNAVMEAMLAGLPVVATRVGGIPELIDDGVTGLLVPPHDAPALAIAIRRLLDDPALGDTLGSAARQCIEERYSFDRMVSAFESLWVEQLTQTQRVPRPAALTPAERRVRTAITEPPAPDNARGTAARAFE
jgi:glycosyltransferase involved in cell wall biosynthesis